MAIEAKVPIVIAAGDFRTKQIHLGKMISVEDLETRSYESIMEELQEYYKKLLQNIQKSGIQNLLI